MAIARELVQGSLSESALFERVQSRSGFGRASIKRQLNSMIGVGEVRLTVRAIPRRRIYSLTREGEKRYK